MENEKLPTAEKKLLFSVDPDLLVENKTEMDELEVNTNSDEHMEKEPVQATEVVVDTVKEAPIRYGGFWMRFWAYLVDLIVIGSIVRLLINPIFRILDLPLSEGDLFAPITIVTAVIFYGYFVLMTKFFGQTLGKMIFGLKVISLEGKKLDWSTVIFREWIGRFISVSFILLYVVTAFTVKKQAIHDLFVSTTVVHEN